MILTYRYRLLPRKRQHEGLSRICEDQRQLYNAALEERIGCYRATGKGRSYVDQCKALTVWRREDPEAADIPLNIQRWTIKRLDEAYKAFFRRAKQHNGKAGFPRFRGKGRWDSFGFNEFHGIRWDGKRLRFAGLPSGLRVHLHRPLSKNADIRSCIFRRTGRMWHVCFQVNAVVAGREGLNVAKRGERGSDNLAHVCESLPTPGGSSSTHTTPDNLAHARESLPFSHSLRQHVGINLGLSVFAYCSDGEVIPSPRISRRAERELRRRQRALARCRRDSKRRAKVRERVARLHRKVANTRNTWLHQQSAALVKRANLIAAEDLNIKGMIRSAKGTIEAPGRKVAAKSGLNRSIADAAWSKFLAMVAYKAECAGKIFVTVDPRNTSQRCSGCGELVPKTLAVRTHSCPHCGLVIDRDWNASLNILQTVLRAGLPAGWAT